MDNRKIEQNAVNAVKQAFSNVDIVYPHIDENDKTECVDGFLQVYSSPKFKADTVEGRLDLQVKGTGSKRKGDRPKRQLRISDLKYFLEIAGGCIYFVVYCGKENTAPEVFYKLLLPYDLKKILASTTTGQQSVTLRFERLPTDTGELTRLIKGAIRDKAKQRTVAGITPMTSEDFENAGLYFEEHRFDIDLLEGETVMDLSPYKHGFYVYGKTSWGELYPVDKIENIVGVEVGTQQTVSAGDVSFDAVVMVGEDDKGRQVKFRGFDLLFDHNTITLNETGTLAERIEELSLMEAMIQTGSISIDGNEYALGLETDADTIGLIGQRIRALKAVEQVVDMLRFKPMLDIGKLNKQDSKVLNMLYRGLVERELLHRENWRSGFGYVRLAGFPLKIVFYEVAENEYRMADGLHPDECLATIFAESDDEKKIPVAPLFAQTADDYRTLANIDPAVFAETLQRFPINDDNATYANDKMLEMLLAYDDGACCSGELLDCCGIAVEALKGYTDKEVYLINKYQVALRKRKLSEDERKDLLNIQMGSSNPLYKACAAALRGDTEMADMLKNTLSEADQVGLETWPIKRFFQVSQG